MRKFKRLTHDSVLRPFNCNIPDLNDFFFDDSLNYLKQLLAVTYVLEDEINTISYFSILNDKIINRNSETKQTISNTLARKIPNEKRWPSYPSVKIARFGVHKDYQKQGIGTDIIGFIKYYLITKNKTGCRFITVDAHNISVGFYLKNGFKFLTEEDTKEETRLMYFDLMTFVR